MSLGGGGYKGMCSQQQVLQYSYHLRAGQSDSRHLVWYTTKILDISRAVSTKSFLQSFKISFSGFIELCKN